MYVPEDTVPENKELNEKLQRKIDHLLGALIHDKYFQEKPFQLEIDLGKGLKATLDATPSSLNQSLSALNSFSFDEDKGAIGETTPSTTQKNSFNLMAEMNQRQMKNEIQRIQFGHQLPQLLDEIFCLRIPPEKRLVIFLDNLDGCPPIEVVNLLDSINLFIAHCRCQFVAGFNHNTVVNGLFKKTKNASFETKRNSTFDPIQKFIERCIQIPFQLPQIPMAKISKVIAERLGNETEQVIVDILAMGSESNPRRLNYLLNIYQLAAMIAKERGLVESGTIKLDLLAKLVVIQVRWQTSLYDKLLSHPSLLGSIENYYEKISLEPDDQGQPGAANIQLNDTNTGSNLEDNSLIESVEKYALLDGLKSLLMVADSSQFKDHDLLPYLSMASSKPEIPALAAPPEFKAEGKIWDELTSNDVQRVQSAMNEINELKKIRYTHRLLAVINDQVKNDLSARVAAGLALGVLGDPRIIDIETVTIPGGQFRMGTDAGDDTSPLHEVMISEFEIAKFPLTNFQYKAFLDGNPNYKEPGEWSSRNFPEGKANHPVVNVSRNDAFAYITWYNEKSGKNFRLPTEAEWEKAAKGLEVTDYPWSNEFDADKCNTRENGLIDTTPVGIYPDGASVFGVMDLAGNIWEWCADWYSSEYYAAGDTQDPAGPTSGEVSVVRGGSWRNDKDHARSVFRHWNGPNYWYDHVGIRLCQTP